MTPAGFRIASIGELLWDMLPDGPRLGGAPANFAAMCAHISGSYSKNPADEVFLVSQVGEDRLGKQALTHLAGRRLNLDYVSVDRKHATGTVCVDFQIQESPTYAIQKDVAWDYIPEPPEVDAFAQSLDAVCFGTLAQRSPVTRGTLRRIVEGTRSRCVRVFDVNLRDPYWAPEMVVWGCAHASVLKMNHEEVPRVAHAVDIPEHSELSVAKAFLRRFPVRMVAITRGAHGSLLVTREEMHEHPGVAARLVDLVGAGDAFTAALTISVLRRCSLAQVAEAANRWGAWAASQRGGMPMPSTAIESIGPQRVDESHPT